MRTSLTILGVMLAIAFTVALLSFSEGFIITTKQTMGRLGEHINALPQETAYHPFPLVEAYGATLPQEVIRKIKDIENVKEAYPIFTSTLMLGPDMTSFMALNGITPSFLTDLRPHLKIEKGRLLKEGDKDVLVVGALVAKTQKLDLGSKVNIKGKDLEVIGILQPSGAVLEDFIVYAPLETIQGLFDSPGKITSIAITVYDPDRASETAKAITDSIPGVVARTLEETLEQVMGFLNLARAMDMGTASIAILIGILFVLTTMMMAVSERVREIGTMRAIGASRGFIFRLILSESVILCLIAGILGCFGGFFLSKLLTFAISQAFDLPFPAIISPRILLWGIIIALFIGALSGLYPAWRISRANIVESLRYE